MRAIMSIFLETLSQANAIYVKQEIYGQKFETIEIFGFKIRSQIYSITDIFSSFETRISYDIETEDGQKLGYYAETKPNFGFGDVIMSIFLPNFLIFNFVGTDMKNRQIFRVHHPSCWFLKRLDVFGSGDRPLGSWQQKFAWFNNKFEFLDTRGRVIMTLTPWSSSIKKGEREVSVYGGEFPGLFQYFTSLDRCHRFRVRFTDAGLTTDEKLISLVGASFLSDGED